MAINKSNIDDLEAWLDGLGTLRSKLLDMGLKTKEELLWLTEDEINKICVENSIPLFDKKRFEMKMLALRALSKTPNYSNVSAQNPKHHHHHHSNNNSIDATPPTTTTRTSRTTSTTTRGRQPTIVRIVFSEAEELRLRELDIKLINIRNKIDIISQNMTSLNWEKDNLDKSIDKTFDKFVIELQKRKLYVKNELNKITNLEIKIMKNHIKKLNLQIIDINNAKMKCDNYLQNTQISSNHRKSKVLKIANHVLNNKNDERIIIPNINQNKMKKKLINYHKSATKSTNHKNKLKSYFISFNCNQNKIKRSIRKIGHVYRIRVPYPPMFEICECEPTQIKIKVWDQKISANKTMSAIKREKTEFIAKIALAAIKNDDDLLISDDDDNDVNDANDANSNKSNTKNDDDKDDNDANENKSNSNSNNNDDDKDKNNTTTKDDDKDDNDDIVEEEHKYNNHNGNGNGNGNLPKKQKKIISKKKDNNNNGNNNINWDEYPVYKPLLSDHKLLGSSSKETISINNLCANTQYLLKLRGYNKYGKGEWTNIYSFFTKLKEFKFISSIINDILIKNLIYDMLNQRLNINNNNKQFILKRIYSTQINGFTSASFHELCDNKENTFIVIESEYGNIFGGYTSSKWISSKQDKWKYDKNSFLFKIEFKNNKNNKNKINIYDCNDKYNAIRTNISSGPCFGSGYDLYICDHSNKLANSYSTPKSYNIPSNIHLGGKKNFKIKNFDVYTVK